MKNNRILVLSASVLVSGLFLQGCEKIVYEPTHLSQSKLQIQEEAFHDNVSIDAMDADYIAALARHYNKQGNGGVELSVTYDPASKSNTAMHANNHVVRISEAFRKNGVSNVDAMILPVKGQGDIGRVLVSYDAYGLKASDDCTMMGGYEGNDVDPDEDYKYGCTRNDAFAKQIARPTDLMRDNGKIKTSDGRRSANIVDLYRSGVPNEPLDGESASE